MTTCPGHYEVGRRAYCFDCDEWCTRQSPCRGCLVLADPDTPNPADYTDAECLVAGRLSQMPAFADGHPAMALPYARCALHTLAGVVDGREGLAWVLVELDVEE